MLGSVRCRAGPREATGSRPPGQSGRGPANPPASSPNASTACSKYGTNGVSLDNRGGGHRSYPTAPRPLMLLRSRDVRVAGDPRPPAQQAPANKARMPRSCRWNGVKAASTSSDEGWSEAEPAPGRARRRHPPARVRTDVAVSRPAESFSTVPSRPEYIWPYDKRGRRGHWGLAGSSWPARRRTRLRAALADGARARREAGDLEASRNGFERAYRLAGPRPATPESMALAALGLAGLWVAERRTVTSTVLLEARLQHVLALLDPRSALALRVRTRLAGRRGGLRPRHARGRAGRTG